LLAYLFVCAFVCLCVCLLARVCSRSSLLLAVCLLVWIGINCTYNANSRARREQRR
jgi:hypothetical protein